MKLWIVVLVAFLLLATASLASWRDLDGRVGVRAWERLQSAVSPVTDTFDPAVVQSD